MAQQTEETTTIRISNELWKKLNIMKMVGESFEEVIWKLIKKETKNERRN